MPSPKKYLLITTGGTIDSEPYEDPQHPPEYAEPLHESLAAQHFREMMAQKGLKEGEDFDVLRWRSKDSKQFTTAELSDLANIIETAAADKIVVTHGTDHMIPNSLAIKNRLAAHPEKTVIFTGAMVPMANDPINVISPDRYRINGHAYIPSDGRRNIADAIIAADAVHAAPKNHGVYVVFHGKIFDPARTTKNFAAGRFESSQPISL